MDPQSTPRRGRAISTASSTSSSVVGTPSTTGRERADSTWSNYSYVSDCDPQLAAERGGATFDGRFDEARQLSEAMAASLEDARADELASSDGSSPSFFSALGAPLDVQLRVAASLTSVADMVALEATSTWPRRPMWRAATISSVGGLAPRIESLSLTEAAAAVLVTEHLRVPRCLPPTTANARHVNRLSLLRVASLDAPAGDAVVVAPSADAAARAGPRRRSPFADPGALRADPAPWDADGCLSLRADYAWRALVLDAEDGAVKVLLVDVVMGWVKNHVVQNRSFPLASPRAATAPRDAFFLGSHLDRWAKLSVA